MRGNDVGEPGVTGLEEALARLDEPAPAGFALRVLRHVGIPEDRYDTYVCLETPAGGLYVAQADGRVTGAVLSAVAPDPETFERLHRERTGRAAIHATAPPTGVRTAVRTGRAKNLRIDLSALPPSDSAVLTAVRGIPHGQLRPLAWIAREASLPDSTAVTDVLARNPAHLLIPCHRVVHDSGQPCDAAYDAHTGDALRRAEGITPGYVDDLTRSHTVLLGSDTTRIYCHPTCAHARRITVPHRVPFRSAGDARRAGYRPCKSCRPVAA